MRVLRIKVSGVYIVSSRKSPQHLHYIFGLSGISPVRNNCSAPIPFTTRNKQGFSVWYYILTFNFWRYKNIYSNIFINIISILVLGEEDEVTAEQFVDSGHLVYGTYQLFTSCSQPPCQQRWRSEWIFWHKNKTIFILYHMYSTLNSLMHWHQEVILYWI